MTTDIVLHNPRVTDRISAAAVSRVDRTRHVIRIQEAKIVDVDTVSQTTRIFAPALGWANEVKKIDRAVAAELPDWIRRHGLREGNLKKTICDVGDCCFFSLKNQPDNGPDAVSTVCDVTAELSDIKITLKDNHYRLIWRILEAEFKERISEEDDIRSNESDDYGPTNDAPDNDAPDNDGADNDGSANDAPGEVSAIPPGQITILEREDSFRVLESTQEERVQSDRDNYPHDVKPCRAAKDIQLSGISEELRIIAERIKELDSRPV
jgi:hypothetical protein